MHCVCLRSDLSFMKVFIFQFLKPPLFTLAASSRVILQIMVIHIDFTFITMRSLHLCFTFIYFVSRLEFLLAIRLQIHNSLADCFH